jgi:hypothetical protein
MSGVDPTNVIERMASGLRSAGAAHPVAGAVALAARGHARLDQRDFAASVGESVDHVHSTEVGEIAFGDLPLHVGNTAAALGIDLLALADLENTWHTAPGGPPSMD